MIGNSAAEAAVYAAAASIPDADASRLVDSVSFMRTVQGLDPEAPGFVGRVAREARAAVTADSRFRRPDGQQQSGGEPSDADGNSRQWTMQDVQAATADEVEAAQEAGLLQGLGYSPPGTARRRR
ncbi:MAG TPA: hypothetical protein VGF32_04935 [Streptosporangiaceae bacterium]|jgi:hypothetical protein